MLDQVLGIQTAPGAFVVKVEPGSPASDAGLALCDVITAFNGGDLRGYLDHRAFRSAIREAAMFPEAILEIWKFDASTYRSVTTQFSVPAHFGASEGLGTRFAVMVVEVPEGSVAAAVGIRQWDFIEGVNGERISDMHNVIELDQKVNAALSHDGKVRLSLGRWKPLASSPEQNTEGTLREVTFTSRSPRGRRD